MSLFTEELENFSYIKYLTADDECGGNSTTYSKGEQFKAAISLDTSAEAKIAEQQGLSPIYSVYTTKTVNLKYHNLIQREKTGEIFRITSNGDDVRTPASAALNMRYVTANKYTLPTGAVIYE